MGKDEGTAWLKMDIQSGDVSLNLREQDPEWVLREKAVADPAWVPTRRRKGEGDAKPSFANFPTKTNANWKQKLFGEKKIRQWNYLFF